MNFTNEEWLQQTWTRFMQLHSDIVQFCEENCNLHLFSAVCIWFISYSVIVVLNFLSFPILARWRAGRIWSFYRWRRIWGISAICLVFVPLVPFVPWPRSCSVLTFKSLVEVTVLDKSLKPRKGVHYFQPIHVKCEHCEKLQTLGDFPLPPLCLCVQQRASYCSVISSSWQPFLSHGVSI